MPSRHATQPLDKTTHHVDSRRLARGRRRQISWPSSDVAKPLRWFESNLKDYVSLRKKQCNSGCHVAEMMLKLAESLVDANGTETMSDVESPIIVRFVENSNAGTSGLPWGITDFEEYIEGVHELYLGEQQGWDRWLDNHIGLEINNEEGQGFLDHIGAKLKENGVKYHAHTTQRDDSVVGAAGSIWTQGVGGLALEIHGAFDFSWFNETGNHALHGMSMCNHNSEEPLVMRHVGNESTSPVNSKLDADSLEKSRSAAMQATSPGGIATAAASWAVEAAEVDAAYEDLAEADVLAGLADAIAAMKAARRAQLATNTAGAPDAQH